MSFGQEFKAMRAQGGAPKSSDIQASVESHEASTETPLEGGESKETYSNPFVDGHTMNDGAEEQTTELTIPPPKAEAKKVPIKINGKSFDTVEEAADYAAKLEIELEKKEAVEKYIESTKAKPEVTPQEEKKIRKIAGKIFENPEEAFEELESYILELAEKKSQEREDKKTEAQIKAEKTQQAIDNFYKANADLVDWQDEVNVVVARNEKELLALPEDKIADRVAELSRAYVASIKEKALPRQALPSKTVISTGQGIKSATATNTQATKKDISFAAQVRSTNRRTALQDEA